MFSRTEEKIECKQQTVAGGQEKAGPHTRVGGQVMRLSHMNGKGERLNASRRRVIPFPGLAGGESPGRQGRSGKAQQRPTG